jgi:hypothetical protein
MNNEYIKFNDVIFTNNETIINNLKDFENLEIEYIEKWSNSKITITYHNNLWSIICKSNESVKIVEKMFICYRIWKTFKLNITFRIDPKISKKVIKEAIYFIQKNGYKVKMFQTFDSSTIVFVGGNEKSEIFNVIEYIKYIIDNNNNTNMRFIYVDFVNFINTLKYIIPIDIDFENDIKIKVSNFDNNLIINNKDINKKRICILGLSNNFNIVWNYIKKILIYKEIENFEKMEYLNIEINSLKKEEKINNEKINLISRKIKKDKYQTPICKSKLPNTVYSSSF